MLSHHLSHLIHEMYELLYYHLHLIDEESEVQGC